MWISVVGLRCGASVMVELNPTQKRRVRCAFRRTGGATRNAPYDVAIGNCIILQIPSSRESGNPELAGGPGCPVEACAGAGYAGMTSRQ